jgi:hypothetical protein
MGATECVNPMATPNSEKFILRHSDYAQSGFARNYFYNFIILSVIFTLSDREVKTLSF